MNPVFQNCPHVFKLKKRLTNFPARVRAVTFLRTAIALIMAISLVSGCAKENKDLAKLQEENRVLKEKIASLESQTNESQTKPAVTAKPEMKGELIVLARKLKSSPNDSWAANKITLQVSRF